MSGWEWNKMKVVYQRVVVYPSQIPHSAETRLGRRSCLFMEIVSPKQHKTTTTCSDYSNYTTQWEITSYYLQRFLTIVIRYTKCVGSGSGTLTIDNRLNSRNRSPELTSKERLQKAKYQANSHISLHARFISANLNHDYCK